MWLIYQTYNSRKIKKKNPYSAKYGFFHGPSGATRTRGILLPKQAPYQLGHTRITDDIITNYFMECKV